MFKNTLIISFLLIGKMLMSQCMLIEASLRDMANKSEVIIEAEVLNSYATWNQNHTMIYTIHELKVYGSYKSGVADKIYLATMGGIVGLRKIETNPELRLNVGDIGMLYLNKNRDIKIQGLEEKIYRPSLNAQSFFQYVFNEDKVYGVFRSFRLSDMELQRETEKNTGLPYVKKQPLPAISSIKADNRMVINSFNPTTITAGTKSVLTINGSGFGSATGSVQFKNADDGGATYMAAQSYEILTWTNTTITVEVPDGAGTGTIRVVPSGGSNITSSTSLTVSSGQILIYYNNATYKTRHSVASSSSPKLVYTLNTDFNANTSAKDAFLRAMKTWTCENDVYWETASSTSSINTALDDNVNIVSFGNAGGALGVTSTYFNGCSSGGGPVFWHTTEMDMIYETGINWNFSTNPPGGAQYDFESVALHELGHSLLLAHVIDGNKVMHYAIANGQSKRDPVADDNAAVADVMSRSTTNSTQMCGYFKINYAPNISVTNTSDSGAGSLRQAVADVCANDTITMSIPASSTITLTSAELTINKDMKIHGLSQSTFSISGNNARRIFNVQSGKTLSLQNMKLINATATTNGGAIFNSGILNLKNVTFQNNFQNGVRKAFTSASGSTVNMDTSVNVNN